MTPGPAFPGLFLGALALAAAAWMPAAWADSGAGLDLVAVPGGLFVMGDPGGEPDERLRRVTVAPFRIMRHEVTVDLFARFVAETGRRSDPERKGFGYVWDGRWRRVNAPGLVPLVRAGVLFSDGTQEEGRSAA